MAKKKTRPSWFKVFAHQRTLFCALDDRTAGQAFKAALDYFCTGKVPELEPMAALAFGTLREYIDEAEVDFRTAGEKNRKNAQKRWANREIPSDATGNQSMPTIPTDAKNTETEAEAETEAETEVKENKADKPPARTRFSPPTAEEVRAYCREKGYTVDAERFVDFYTSNGWKVGKNPMKDWKAAVRNWSRQNKKEEKNHGTNESGKSDSWEWSTGTVL